MGEWEREEDRERKKKRVNCRDKMRGRYKETDKEG